MAETAANRAGLTRDTAYQTLADKRKRSVIRSLHQHIATDDGDGLVITRDALCAQLQDDTGYDQPRAMAALHHTVLPALEETGAIRYRAGAGEVAVLDPNALDTLMRADAKVTETLA